MSAISDCNRSALDSVIRPGEVRTAPRMHFATITLLCGTLTICMVSGCGIACADWFTGYEVTGELRGADGEALEGVEVDMRLVNGEGETILPGGPIYDTDADPVITDGAGRFQGRVAIFTGQCRVGLELFFGPLASTDPPLPDPAFIVLTLVDTGEEISIEVSRTMITPIPDDVFFQQLDLGVVVTPG